MNTGAKAASWERSFREKAAAGHPPDALSRPGANRRTCSAKDAPDKRYVVLTVTGFLTARKGRHSEPPGLSAHVVDTGYGDIVRTYRTEDASRIFNGHHSHRRHVVALAQAHADHLNAEAHAS